jgi:hypothetical protein
MTIYKIGPHTIEKVNQELHMLLEDHMDRMNKAYLANEEDLSVSISLKFRPHKTGATEIDYQISYTESKVKEGDKIIVDEQQRELFENGK